ncbi:hypothetical protein H5232_17665 [Pseudoalteromonas sp. SG41-5]|uniref:hypothetical protein n=1 Tax=Pseudoalteromonas sp. SG41-5 TaxID=2760975 RepID=UPI00160356AA|nr:hypothetical protein [Pseudoalteromonas sp. SG41-5]MBB1470257.1 hypothetical protein [Pseudoalteromonas sp. SG41-5]
MIVMKLKKAGLNVFSVSLVTGLFGCQSQPQQETVASLQEQHKTFYQQVMLAAPVLPADLTNIPMQAHLVANRVAQSHYKTAAQVNYSQLGWQQRVAADWHYFDIPTSQGKLLVIDYQQQGNQLAYRYLANGTQNDLYEPWSSSKIQAFSGAIAKVRQINPELGAHALIGDSNVADLITSINSYEHFGSADGNSNAIASYFINVAGRDYLSNLFADNWLKLNDSRIMFKGAYATEIFTPSTIRWQSTDSDVIASNIAYFTVNTDDPAYLDYRCDGCGLTGNKAMTTLAQAEWLKRLASHTREPLTQQPLLQAQDIDVLFNGTGNTDKTAKVGGMMQGLSQMITDSLAQALAPDDTRPAKQILDELTQGQWRVWQKIGWGPSETRSTTETVMLAHVYLPFIQGGREFTLVAQNSVPGASEKNLAVVGLKMQANFTHAFKQLLIPQKQ